MKPAAPHRLRTDGAARGNPGPAGIGVILESPKGKVIAEAWRGIGWATNNVAEYQALIEGLEVARRKGVEEIEVLLDSVLLVEQMKGAYKVKSPALKPLHRSARTLADEFRRIEFVQVPRGENWAADALANRGIDEWLKENPRPTPPKRAQGELF